MGSKFVEKHKRKSILAALLFIFQGRTKYIGILLVITILSIPFALSGETLSRILELRPVAAFLRTVGLSSVVSTINPKYSNDLLKAALDRASADSKDASFWQKFLNRINSTLPPGGGPSSIAMLRGGGEDLFGPLEVKDGKYDKKAGPGQVKGVLNEEERAKGYSGDDVDLQGLLAGGPGYEGSGLYGDQMERNMSSSASGGGPYLNRTMFNRPGGAAAGGAAGLYSNVMSESSNKVPVPSSARKINSKRMGRVSGFSWKNVGYGRGKSDAINKLGSKKPMFQLAETFSMAGSAANSKDSAYEYQAAYVGSTYDGNETGADVIETSFDSPTVPPDSSFTGDLLINTQDLQNQAKACSDAQGTHGAAMSEDGKKMDDISKTLGKPPKCCSGGVGAWNSKVNQIQAACQDYNAHEVQLAAACQNKSSPMDCSYSSKMHINPCSKWKCWLAIILMVILAFLTFGWGAALIVGVLAAGSILGNGSMFGMVGDMIGGFISKLAGGE